ncbi:hypothetical protein [Thermincola ferriacetica]
MVVNLCLILFQSFPENILVISSGLVLTGLRPRLPKIIIIAAITSVISHIVRALPLAPGLHIVLQFPVLVMLVTCFYKLNITYAILASSIGVIGITLCEMILNPILSLVTGIPIKEVLKDPFWRFVFPIPEFILMAILVYFLFRKRITLFDVQEFQNLEHVENHE